MFFQLMLRLFSFKSLNVWVTFQERIPVPVPERTKEDVLLFFKLYHPEKEELQYVSVVDEPDFRDVNMLILFSVAKMVTIYQYRWISFD